MQKNISIHAPRVGRDRSQHPVGDHETISIHAPRVGRDCFRRHADADCRYFNPRAPCGARRNNRVQGFLQVKISIHAPRVGRDRARQLPALSNFAISIHAPRVGRD